MTYNTVRYVKETAANAVKLAVLLLGSKASERMIEVQARDFMELGSEKIKNALRRQKDAKKRRMVRTYPVPTKVFERLQK